MGVRVAQAIEQRDRDYLQDIARRQAEAGAHYIDVNAAAGRVVVLKATWILEGIEAKGKLRSPLVEVFPLLEDLKERYPGLVLLGPMTLEESMKGKMPDVFLVPDAEAGQVVSHAISAFAGGKAGHVILGGKVPLVLMANNPTVEHLWRSVLLALNAIV